MKTFDGFDSSSSESYFKSFECKVGFLAVRNSGFIVKDSIGSDGFIGSLFSGFD